MEIYSIARDTPFSSSIAMIIILRLASQHKSTHDAHVQGAPYIVAAIPPQIFLFYCRWLLKTNEYNWQLQLIIGLQVLLRLKRILFSATSLNMLTCNPFSSVIVTVIWHCWLGDRTGIQPVKSRTSNHQRFFFEGRSGTRPDREWSMETGRLNNNWE